MDQLFGGSKNCIHARFELWVYHPYTTMCSIPNSYHTILHEKEVESAKSTTTKKIVTVIFMSVYLCKMVQIEILALDQQF